MKKYNIVITETLRKVVRVEAESKDNAIDKVYDLYSDCDIILGGDDFDGYDIYSLGEGCDDSTANDLLTDESYPVDIDFTEEE